MVGRIVGVGMPGDRVARGVGSTSGVGCGSEVVGAVGGTNGVATALVAASDCRVAVPVAAGGRVATITMTTASAMVAATEAMASQGRPVDACPVRPRPAGGVCLGPALMGGYENTDVCPRASRSVAPCRTGVVRGTRAYSGP